MALPKPPTAQQIQKAAMAKASAKSPYFYGGGVQKPAAPKPPAAAAAPATDWTKADYSGLLGGWSPVPQSFTGIVPGFSTDANGRIMAGYDVPADGTPDWNTLINANYLTQQAEGQAGPMRSNADIALKSGLAGALFQYGWDPATMSIDKLGGATPYIDQAAIDAATGNKYSALATIARNQDLAQRAAEANLASRGILSSGQLNSDTENIGYEAGGQRSSAFANLMNQVGQGLNQRASVEDQIAKMLQDARAQAAQFVAGTYTPPSTDYMPDTDISALLKWAYGQQTGETPLTAPPPVAPARVPTATAPKVQASPSGIAAAKKLPTPKKRSPYYYGGGG